MDPQANHISDVSTADFGRVLQRSNEVPVLVDFWAEWCGPCKTLGPLLEKLTTEHNGAFELVKVDVDQNQELAEQFGVQGIPTVIAFVGGQATERFTGALPEPQLREFLATLLPSDLDRRVEDARDAALNDDLSGAEQIFREVLAEQTDHPDAGTGLASLLLARDQTEEALIVLGKLTPTPEVDRLQAAARLQTARGADDLGELQKKADDNPDDDGLRLDLAKALAARNEYEPSLDHLLAIVRNRGERLEDAKTAMLDIFGVLGNEHPLTLAYRRQLSSALF